MTDVHTQPTSSFAPAAQGACPTCNAPVADDQRYCLSCGTVQAPPRVDFAELLAGEGKGTPPGAPGAGGGSEPPARDWTPVLALGGLAALALVLVVGVLIGRGANNAVKQAAAPQVITVNGSGAGTGSTNRASSTSISEDWPAGQSGWTVQLQTVPKAGATTDSVNAAKSAATGKGATGVGVLDAANYTNIGSDYVIYSGDYKTQKEAQTALGKVKKSFPAAKVIHVVPSGSGGGGGAGASGGVGTPVSAAQQAAGAAQIQKIQQACNGASTAACSKATKTTTPIATPGAAPPTDNKPAGGGGGAQTIQ
jgi:hypothetical protein